MPLCGRRMRRGLNDMAEAVIRPGSLEAILLPDSASTGIAEKIEQSCAPTRA